MADSICSHCNNKFSGTQSSRLCPRCFIAGHRGVRCSIGCRVDKPAQVQNLIHPNSIIGRTLSNQADVLAESDRVMFWNPETIEFAAIKATDGRIFAAKRHDEIIRTMIMDYDTSPHYGVQGFLTNRLRFVDRKEAATIALNSGQVSELKFQPSELFSEDLW